jgi:hypothetical protein
MSQLLRFGRRGVRVRVPADLFEAVIACLSLYVDDPDVLLGAEPQDWERDTLAALQRFEKRRQPIKSRWRTADEADLCLVLNLLDSELINGLNGCEEIYRELGLTWTKDEPECESCEHWRALIVRDRIDYWLDRSGAPKGSYYASWKGEVPDTIEATFRRMWEDVRYKELAAQAAVVPL